MATGVLTRRDDTEASVGRNPTRRQREDRGGHTVEASSLLSGNPEHDDLDSDVASQSTIHGTESRMSRTARTHRREV
jgi:hypothetical protein